MPTAPPPSRDVTIETRVFWLRYKTEIIAALIVALLAIIGVAGYRVYSDHREAAAADLLARAKSVQDYRQVIARYSGTPASADAYLLLADSQRAEKKFAEANATLELFVSKNPDHELVSTARTAMAANLESMGKTDEALAMYQQIAMTYPKSFSAPLALISRMYLLKAKGRNDEALQTCEKILTDYRDSMWAREAMQQMRSLKPTVTSPPGQTSTEARPGAQPPPPPLLARPPVGLPKSAPTPGGKKPQ